MNSIIISTITCYKHNTYAKLVKITGQTDSWTKTDSTKIVRLNLHMKKDWTYKSLIWVIFVCIMNTSTNLLMDHRYFSQSMIPNWVPTKHKNFMTNPALLCNYIHYYWISNIL